MREIDQYYLSHEEPVGGCLQYLRTHILNFDSHLTEAWKYRMPFFCYKGKMFCFLWTKPKTGQPYIGFVAGHKMYHPDLLIEKRAKMKILLIDPHADIPLEKIDFILREAIALAK